MTLADDSRSLRGRPRASCQPPRTTRARFFGGDANRRPNRRRRDRAPRVRRVRQSLGVAEHGAHVFGARAELLGGDLREDRARAGAEILRAGEHVDAAVAIDAHRGVRRRSAARAPDDATPSRRRAGAPDASPRAARARLPSRSDERPRHSSRSTASASRAASCPDRARRSCGGAARADRSPARAPARPSRTRARTRLRRGPARGTTPSRRRSCTRTSRTCGRSGSDRARDRCAPGPASQPPMPSAIVASTSIAVSVPSRFAPIVTRCIVAGRLPASVCSPSRSSMQLTGPVELSRQQRRDVRRMRRTVLRAESAAHVVLHHAHARQRHLRTSSPGRRAS